jgi:hypothetical protein
VRLIDLSLSAVCERVYPIEEKNTWQIVILATSPTIERKLPRPAARVARTATAVAAAAKS